MEHHRDSALYPSGRTVYLSSLSSGMKVLSGELNLFLIRFEADGSAGDRAFLAVLRAGDAFCPETSICVGGIRYELAAVPSGDVSSVPSEVSRGEWRNRLQTAVSEVAGTRIEAENVPGLLSALIRAAAFSAALGSTVQPSSAPMAVLTPCAIAPCRSRRSSFRSSVTPSAMRT